NGFHSFMHRIEKGHLTRVTLRQKRKKTFVWYLIKLN
uniref:Uncharacterized protein n=1 Tax=Amphimedon queenslandica TaxID=400682 RepID=A0A1X7UCU9_AMPQE